MSDINIRELIVQINKKLGEEAIKLAKDVEGTFLVRRPCGIFSIDLATAGGLPAGTMNKIGGAEGLGKNYLADCYLAECQRIYGDEAKIFIACGEYPYDKLRALENGVKIALTEQEINQYEASRGCSFSSKEREALRSQVGEIAMVSGLTMDKTLQTVLDLMESDMFHIGLVDSMDSLLPEEQQDRDIGDPKVGSSAMVQTSFMKRFHHIIGKSRRTMLLTLGQARANIPGPGVRTFTKMKVNDPYSVKHGLVGKIVLTSGGYIQENDKGPKIGKILRWSLDKGKAGFHDGPSGELKYYYKGGVDKLSDFIEVAKHYMERAGKYYDLPISDGKVERVVGLEGFLAFVQSHPEEVEYLKRAIYEKNGIVFCYHEDEKTAGGKGRKATRKKTGRKEDEELGSG